MSGFTESIQCGVSLGLLHFVGFFNVFFFGLEVGTFQPLGNFLLERFTQLGHELAQHPPLSRRHHVRLRLLWRLKIMQIAQVWRHWLRRRHRLHQLQQQGRTPTAHVAQHKQVVVRLRHRQAKAGGFLSARLTDPGQRLTKKFSRGLKPQRCGRNSDAKFMAFQGGEGHEDSQKLKSCRL